MNPDIYKRSQCRYCDTPLAQSFLDLGSMPLANNLITEQEIKTPQFECPLSLTLCSKCYLVQLTHIVPPEKMFSHYLYVSSTTKTFQDHFSDYARTVRKILKKKDLPFAIDIGSNDGLLVSCYMKEGMRALGIDPAKNLADEANQKGIKTINRFFDEHAVKEILAEEGKADVISGNNVFAHIDDIQSVLRNVTTLLSDDGIFVIEFPYLIVMLETLVFDMIYHEHLSYIAIHPLQYVLDCFEMKIFDIQEVSSHGGSLRVFIQKKKGLHQISQKVEQFLKLETERGCLKTESYQKFAEQVLQVKKNFMDFIKEAKKLGQTVAGYGAPAKASTVVNFYGLTEKDISYIVDDNPLKQGRLIPGANIRIVPSAYLKTERPDYLVLFAWNFAKEILSKIGSLKDQGTSFLVPLIKPDQLMAGSHQAFQI